MELICKPKPRGLGGAYPPYSEVAEYSILLSEKDFWKSECLRLAGAVGALSPLQSPGFYPPVIPVPSSAPANWPSPSQFGFPSEYCHFFLQRRPAMPPHPPVSVTHGCAEVFGCACPQLHATCAGCLPLPLLPDALALSGGVGGPLAFLSMFLLWLRPRSRQLPACLLVPISPLLMLSMLLAQ